MSVPVSPLPLYGLDIETDTTVDGLDPAKARVIAVALSSERADHVFMGDEPRILEQLDEHLAGLDPGILVTWNGAGFDLPFLAERAGRCNTSIGLRIWPLQPFTGSDPYPSWPPPPGGFGGSWGEHRHLDGFRVFRADVRRTLPVSCGLKPMARLVGLDPVEVDYEQLHDMAPAELAHYVASDARMARLLVERRLPGVLTATDPPPSVNLRGVSTPVVALQDV